MTDRPVDLSFLKDEAVKYIDLSSLRIANCVDALDVGQRHRANA